MASFCKKSFFLPLPSPRKLNKASFTNAFRPDCPSPKFREQQNSSDNSEDSESTEGTESAEATEAPVSEPGSDRHSGRVGILACPVESTGRYPVLHFLRLRSVQPRPVRQGHAGPHPYMHRVGHHHISVQWIELQHFSRWSTSGRGSHDEHFPRRGSLPAIQSPRRKNNRMRKCRRRLTYDE